MAAIGDIQPQRPRGLILPRQGLREDRAIIGHHQRLQFTSDMRRSALPTQVLPVEQTQQPFLASLYGERGGATLRDGGQQNRRHAANVAVLKGFDRIILWGVGVHHLGAVWGHGDDTISPISATLVGGEVSIADGEEDAARHGVYYDARSAPNAAPVVGALPQREQMGVVIAAADADMGGAGLHI